MNKFTSFCWVFLGFLAFAGSSFSQSSEFAFQGRLTDSGVPVAVNYDLRFKLYSQSAGGTAIGTVERTDVPVSNGVFTVKLDFGAAAFDGAARWIETEVKPSGSGTYQPLNPRVFLTTVPYSVRSLSAENAVQLGGVAATEFVQTTDPRMTDPRPPAPGDGNYIQNTTIQQAISNFNISGTGTVGGTLAGNILDATIQYNLNGGRIISIGGTENLFVGVQSGASNTSGSSNSFVGRSAGFSNTIGLGNDFFGAKAGISNSTGSFNSFFGSFSGASNSTGNSNSFVGRNSGSLNTVGFENSFFGVSAGAWNVNGAQNTFLGAQSNTNENLTRTEVNNATAIGFRAYVTQSNSLVLGSINGQNGATADTKVGIGTTAPSEKFEVRDNSASMIVGGAGCPGGSITIGLNGAFGNCANYSVRGDGSTLWFNRPTGGQIVFRENNGPTQLRLRSGGVLQLETLGTAGATPLCHNAANDISTCSSSIRFKTNVSNYGSSLDLIRKLRPVSFNWKDSGMPDIGLVAEEVAEVEPLLTTTNGQGEIEGVKYDRVGVVLVNAVNEQQVQIEELSKTVVELKRQIEELRSLLCLSTPNVEVCRKQ